MLQPVIDQLQTMIGRRAKVVLLRSAAKSERVNMIENRIIGTNVSNWYLLPQDVDVTREDRDL